MQKIMKKELYETNEVESILKQEEVEEKGRPERKRGLEDEMNTGLKESELNEGGLEGALDKARENITELPDSESEIVKDSSLEEKLTPARFREEIEKQAEKFEGSTAEKVINFARDTVSNLKICEGAREGFAEIVSDSIIEVLVKAKIDKEELSEIKEIIDIGGGYGDNLKAVITKIKEIRENDEKINGVCLDNKTSLSKGIEKDEEITGSYQDARKTSFEDDSFNLVMATHLLQEIKGIENKENILLEMARISKGRIVFMVELKRSGFDGQKDKLNHFINNFNFKYDVLEKKEYEDLFEKLGFTIKAQMDPDKESSNKITYLLKISKEEDKTE